jgi:hypothetical protein
MSIKMTRPQYDALTEWGSTPHAHAKPGEMFRTKTEDYGDSIIVVEDVASPGEILTRFDIVEITDGVDNENSGKGD